MTPLERALTECRCRFGGVLCSRLPLTARLFGCTATNREECMTVLLTRASIMARVTLKNGYYCHTLPMEEKFGRSL